MDTTARTPAETRCAIRRWIAQATLGWLGYAAILFAAAGRVNWVWGWVFVGILAALLAAHPLILIPINPDLLAERQQGIHAEGTKRWDRWLAPLAAGVFPMLSWIIAGLDLRFGWSAGLPTIAHVAGVAGVVSGLALFLWAMASNAFFVEGVRIQSDRGQTVAEGGPYRVVRHPGYAGAILAQAATPLLRGSPWALIPTAGSVIGYIVRTALEDKTLLAELRGYAEFSETTQYRLVPGLW
ncbi:MAG: isoprenylcysteine carboxylmethyltransferase family protein [Anaerolineae bacterium]|nr:isoprenylcysteine carboxylmethyltransferase family protein [Anaerolineae bacterium]